MIIIVFIAAAIIVFAAKKPKEQPRPVVYDTVSPADLARIEKEREKAIKAAEKAERDAEKEKARADREKAAKEQARKDIEFYADRLETLYLLETSTSRAYDKAVETVQLDAEQNKYSLCVGIKVVQAHIAERDKLQRQLLKVQAQIHGAEAKVNKAKNILKD